ncbi:probable thiopurine S-methyltransferase isoform X2 [Ptychodera flava]|uniref:probable thiopurine S-methyltransferase isoform X2 n=2 Tax=Ptychodera flava TaxID=63121 RepID=UPI003969C905
MDEQEKWQNRWLMGKIGFHKNYVNDYLIDNIDLLTGGKKGIKIFVPLCGKSIDLKWFADLGHDVTGLEFCDVAIKTFFEEQQMDYAVSQMENLKGGTIFKSKEHNIQVYCCDFFDFSSSIAGQFDAVWDRLAFGGLPPCKHKQGTIPCSNRIHEGNLWRQMCNSHHSTRRLNGRQMEEKGA